MTKEVLTYEQYELKKINNKCLEITAKMLLNDKGKLEYCNCMLGKSLMQLEDINNEHIYCIRELKNEITKKDIVSIDDREKEVI